ncbi:MAG: Ig-like domain-containing protein, partial [Phycisphaerales bacterium]
ANGATAAAGSEIAIEGVGTITIAADGSYWFVPESNWSGVVPAITYTTNTGASATLSITVTPVDNPSNLGPDTFTLAEDSILSGTLLGNDSDVDKSLAVASFTIGGTAYAAGTTAVISGIGSLAIAANGSFTFTPVANWNGSVPQVTYKTNTGSSGTLGS